MTNIMQSAPYHPMPNVHNFKDRTGLTFGRLTVLGYAGARRKHRLWVCQCECGNTRTVAANNLATGHTNSCGCYCADRIKEVHTTHGMSYTRTHRSWLSMKDRCHNSNSTAFADYGGRGIRICKRWLVFENFLNDMGIARDGMTLERVDVNKNYGPGNCEWIPLKMQNRNKRSTVYVTILGEKISLIVACEKYNTKYETAYRRLRRGWSDKEVIFGRSVPDGS